jgi:hypothetical protein
MGFNFERCCVINETHGLKVEMFRNGVLFVFEKGEKEGLRRGRIAGVRTP